MVAEVGGGRVGAEEVLTAAAAADAEARRGAGLIFAGAGGVFTGAAGAGGAGLADGAPATHPSRPGGFYCHDLRRSFGV